MTMLTLPEVLKAVNSLPSLPAVVLELIASLDDDDVDIDTLAGKIALDQALSAKTLRLANSSFYGVQRQVTSPRDAVTVLGFRTLRSLATTAALVGALGAGGNPSFGFLAFWRHAIGTALCARALALQLALNSEAAYMAGLMHDIGRLVLATRFAGAYASVIARRRADDCYPVDAERAVLGLDHAMVGEALARHWKFPEAILHSTAHHHNPGVSAEPLAMVVHVADAIAHALDLSDDPDDLVPEVSDQSLQMLGLDAQCLIAIFQDVEKKFEATCSVLA